VVDEARPEGGHEEPDGPLRGHPPVQPLPRPQQLRALRPGREAARHLHHRRGRAAQLGPGGRALHRHHGPSPRHRPQAAALPVRRAHLPRAHALGRALRLHVFGGRVLGQVRPRVGGRPLRRGLRGRDDGVALLIKGVLEERAKGGHARRQARRETR
jgi:hypothetical protein